VLVSDTADVQQLDALHRHREQLGAVTATSALIGDTSSAPAARRSPHPEPVTAVSCS
jgi:hypothetical protein